MERTASVIVFLMMTMLAVALLITYVYHAPGPPTPAFINTTDGRGIVTPQSCSPSTCNPYDESPDDCLRPACVDGVCVPDAEPKDDGARCSMPDGSLGTCTDGGCVALPCSDTRSDAAVCAAAGKECGESLDNCDNLRACPQCPSGSSCVDDSCVPDCGDTCASLGYECGTQTVCGAVVDCGACAGSCVAGRCILQCGNSWCDAGETATNCPADCSYRSELCGETIDAKSFCDAYYPYNENPVDCPIDCSSSTCGDGICDLGEFLGPSVDNYFPCASDCFNEGTGGAGIVFDPSRQACIDVGGYWQIPVFQNNMGLYRVARPEHVACCPSPTDCAGRLFPGAPTERYDPQVGGMTLDYMVCYKTGTYFYMNGPDETTYLCSNGDWRHSIDMS